MPRNSIVNVKGNDKYASVSCQPAAIRATIGVPTSKALYHMWSSTITSTRVRASSVNTANLRKHTQVGAGLVNRGRPSGQTHVPSSHLFSPNLLMLFPLSFVPFFYLALGMDAACK